MNRRESLSTLLASLASLTTATPLTTRAQPAAKPRRIGYLALRSRGHPLEAAFVAELTKLGYVEGKNITIEWRFADTRVERLPALAAELVTLRVEVLVAAGTQAITAAATATKTIPIVFPGAADPVGSGFVKSLQRPGGNVTGFSTMGSDLGGKQIETLRSVLPRMTRLAVLVNPTNSSVASLMQNFDAGAKKTGVTIQQFGVQTPEAIDQAFAAMAKARIEAVAVTVDSFLLEETKRIATLALRYKLPLISTQQSDVEAGSLMSYGAVLADNYRRTAGFVIKILKGAKPADLPVEQPTRIELVINMKTAKALGITFPHDIMVRADRMIE